MHCGKPWMKSHHVNQSSPISFIEADGVAHCDNPSIAKILNVHYSTTGTKLAMKLKSFITLPSPPARSTDLPKFVFKPIIEEFVRGQLKQLRTNKAIGLDNIVLVFWKTRLAWLVKVSRICLINLWSLVASLPYGSLERYLPSSKKAIAVTQTTTG